MAQSGEQSGDLSQEKYPASPIDFGALTKLATMLAALAYGTGVVAINTYLHGLGIADFSFAKPKLLLTGILVLFTFLLLAAHLFFLAWSVASQHGPVERRLPPLKAIALWALVFLLMLIAASASLCFRKEPGLGQLTVREAREKVGMASQFARGRSTLRVSAEVYLPILVAALFVYWATRLYDRTRTKTEGSRLSLDEFYFVVAVAVVGICVIGYVYMFTRTFYPAIPQEFGGGQPYYESFAVVDDQLCKLEQIGVPFEPQQPSVTEPLPVLHETDTLVAVWLKCPTTQNCNNGDNGGGISHFVVVQIDKSAISAIRAYARAAGAAKVTPFSGLCTPPLGPNTVPAAH
jgi:hypothetical protein